MPPKQNSEMIEVFAGTNWQAEMLKSLLENAEINAFVKDAIMGTLNPWWTAPGGAGSVKVFVPNAYLETAKQIVSEYEANMKD
jgi:hypothetical protein